MRSLRTQLAVLATAVLAAFSASAFAADSDSDGLSDEFETAYGTDPNDDDSDGDGKSDYAEVVEDGTDPNEADTDGDTLGDGTDPNPLIPLGGVQDGGDAATHGGWATGTPHAWSGESPMDGQGVYAHNGAHVYSTTVGQTSGVGRETALTIGWNSQSPGSSFTGEGTHSFLDMTASEDGFGNVTMLLEDGVERTFVWNPGSSTFTSPSGCTCILTKISSGVFERTFPTTSCSPIQTYRYSNFRLECMADRFDNRITIGRDGNGLPTTITDTRGEEYTLTLYEETERLETLTAPDGATWTFLYNAKGQLHQIVGPETTSLVGAVTQEFRYTNGSSDPDLNNNLIAVFDGNGQKWLRMVYDASDRVAQQYVGDSEDPFTFNYFDAANFKTTVFDRAGNERIWEWDATKKTKKELTEKTNRNVRSGEGDYVTKWSHDSDGHLLSVTYPRGNGVKYTLSSVKQPTEVRRKTDMTAADGSGDLVESYTYEGSNKFYVVATHTDASGEVTTYTNNSYGQPTTITFPTLTNVSPSVTVTHQYTYNANGTVASFTDGEGKVTAYAYYPAGARKGRVQFVTVDDGGLELTTEYDYEDWGSVKSVEDARGNTTTFVVERYGNVTKVTAPAPLGYETEYLHDGNLNVILKRVKNVDYDGTALSSPTHWITSYSFTMMDRVEALTEAVNASTNRTTTYVYDPNDQVASVARGTRETRMVYDERGLLYTRTREAGGSATDPVEEFTYDGNRNLTVHENARGKTTTHTYDLFDRREKTANALGHYAVSLYDPEGRVLEQAAYEEAGSTDVLLAHHKNHYDDMGRFWKEEDLLKGTSDVWYARTYSLDKRGLVTKVKDRRDYETTYAYDGAGRRITATDPIGNATAWTYDANGNATEVEETEKIPGSGSTEVYETTFEFDAVNRLKKRTEIDRTNGSNTKVTEWKRNSIGVVRKEIDPLAYETTRTADGLARVTQESRDMGSSAAIVTSWTWSDTHDEVLTLTDDNGSDTDYTFNDLGRLVEKGYEDSTTVAYEYDLNGNVLTITDQMGTVIEQGFDDLDRLTVRDATPATGVGGDTEHDFAYDALNRLTSAADDDSLVEYTYDSLSRVLTEKQGSNPFGSTAKTVTYTWDAEGNRTKILYPSSFEARETRDALGRITEIKDQSDVSVAAFDLYGPGLRKKKVTFGNTTTGNWSYDGFRRPTNIEHKTSGSSEFAGFEYAWDKNDNPLYEARSHKSGKGDVYTYDKANRLTKVLRDIDDPAAEIASAGSETYIKKLEYDMDDVFNLTAYKETPYGGSATTTSFSANAMNEYTSVGGVAHLYHDNGSLKDDGTNEYKYDAWSHLIEVKRKSDSVVIGSYKYDAVGLGRRTNKTASSITTRFVYADLQSVEELDDSDGDLLRLFVFGQQIDQIVMMEAPDQADVDDDSNTTEIKRFFYHTQLIGTVTHVTDASQTTVESYEYDPYGKPTIKDIGGSAVSASPIGNSYLFTARQMDGESGIHYYRARHYSAELRRFVQRDPLEYDDGPNTLTYAAARVTVLTDSLGLRGSRPCASPGISSDEPGYDGPSYPPFWNTNPNWPLEPGPPPGGKGNPGGGEPLEPETKEPAPVVVSSEVAIPIVFPGGGCGSGVRVGPGGKAALAWMLLVAAYELIRRLPWDERWYDEICYCTCAYELSKPIPGMPPGAISITFPQNSTTLGWCTTISACKRDCNNFCRDTAGRLDGTVTTVMAIAVCL